MMRRFLSLVPLLAPSLLLLEKGIMAFSMVSSSHRQRFVANPATTKCQTKIYGVVNEGSDATMWTSDVANVKLLPINLLSFDGGGIKGALSTRLIAFSLQQVLSGQDRVDPSDPSKKSWQSRMVNYVESFEDCYGVMWTIWAQQLDSMGIEPQIPTPGKKQKTTWMSFTWENPEHQKMIRSILRIDLAYEFYISHVLAISGTSTGGIIAAGTMLRMTLTQLVAMYMDPKICDLIFSNNVFLRPGAGIIQAKYPQSGVEEVANRVLRWIAPGVEDHQSRKPKRKFVAAARTFNDCIKARILGGTLPLEEKQRIELTLRKVKSLYPDRATICTTPDTWVEAVFENRIRKASEFLDLARMKRFKILNDETRDHCLLQLNIKEKSDSYDQDYFATRFLVTSRCVNNGAAVIFDSHEMIQKGQKMTANGALQFGDKSLDVQEMEVRDIIMATSAAPYFFPAHEVNLNGNDNIKIFFHDGGVMANDPGLINACYAYQHFTPSSVKKSTKYSPLFKLFRVGCGKEERWEDSPIKWNTPQGATIVTKLADIFMSSDTARTNLLAKLLGQTYSLVDYKLDSFVPTGKGNAPDLPMDKKETIDLINALFAKLDPRLVNHVAIPEEELRTGLDQDWSIRTDLLPEEIDVMMDLVRNIREGANFLTDAEKGKPKQWKLVDTAFALLDALVSK